MLDPKTIKEHKDEVEQNEVREGNKVLQSMLLGNFSENEILAMVAKLKVKHQQTVMGWRWQL